MKFSIKFLPFIVLALLFSTNVDAQRRGGDPVKMAEKQTQMMTDSLTLSTAQATKVGEINLKYANLKLDFRKAARESGDFDRMAMREKMTKMKEEQNAELQTILTKDQWAKYETVEAATRERRKTERGSKGKKRKRPRKENKS